MTFQRLTRAPVLLPLILCLAMWAMTICLPAQIASDPKPPPVASPTDESVRARAARALEEFYSSPATAPATPPSSQVETQPAPIPPPFEPQPTPLETRPAPMPPPTEPEPTPAPPLSPLREPIDPVPAPAVSETEPAMESQSTAAVEEPQPEPAPIAAPLEPEPAPIPAPTPAPPPVDVVPAPVEPVQAPPVSPPVTDVEGRAAEALDAFYKDPARVKSSFPPPQFEPWPEPPPPLRPFPEPVVQTPTPRPSIPDTAEGRQLYSFRAENMELKSALAVFARANKLNIVPDQDVVGQVTLDVADLSLERIMQALLEAHDFTWTMEDGLIRVRTTETRTFVVDYLRLKREGTGMSLVTLSSSSQGGSGGRGGGGGGGGGMSGGGGGMSGGGNTSGSAMNLTLENPIEFWRELEEQLQRLLSPRGQDRIAINQTAGLIQVTDHPSAIRKIEDYLGRMNESVTRQVDIEAKLYDVVLRDQFQFGIDWEHVVAYMGGQMAFQGLPTVIDSTAGAPGQNMPMPVDPGTGPATRNPFGNLPFRLPSLRAGYGNENTKIILTALSEQGDVRVISQPRLRTLNNQTAIMKVGTDVPFWTSYTITDSTGGSQTTVSGDEPTTITVGTVLALTPQISTDGWISIDISPAISSLVEILPSPSGNSSGPVLDIKQASTIVRLRDGETIVIGGLIQNSTVKSRRKIPILGDIPLLGKLFTGHFDTSEKKELVIFLTPTVVR
jgi:MSHA biogenesis protein MshL